MPEKIMVIEVSEDHGRFLAELYELSRKKTYIKGAYGPSAEEAMRTLVAAPRMAPNYEELREEVWQDNG